MKWFQSAPISITSCPQWSRSNEGYLSNLKKSLFGVNRRNVVLDEFNCVEEIEGVEVVWLLLYTQRLTFVFGRSEDVFYFESLLFVFLWWLLVLFCICSRYIKMIDILWWNTRALLIPWSFFFGCKWSKLGICWSFCMLWLSTMLNGKPSIFFAIIQPVVLNIICDHLLKLYYLVCYLLNVPMIYS